MTMTWTDAEGDTWTEQEDGSFLCRAHDAWVPSLDELARTFGPLQEA